MDFYGHTKHEYVRSFFQPFRIFEKKDGTDCTKHTGTN